MASSKKHLEDSKSSSKLKSPFSAAYTRRGYSKVEAHGITAPRKPIHKEWEERAAKVGSENSVDGRSEEQKIKDALAKGAENGAAAESARNVERDSYRGSPIGGHQMGASTKLGQKKKAGRSYWDTERMSERHMKMTARKWESEQRPSAPAPRSRRRRQVEADDEDEVI